MPVTVGVATAGLPNVTVYVTGTFSGLLLICRLHWSS